MRVAIAQLDQRAADAASNARTILEAVAAARRVGAGLVVTPELSLCGLPHGNLPLSHSLVDACAREIGALAAQIGEEAVIVGLPEREGGALYDAAAILRDGRVEAVYRKQSLPGNAIFGAHGFRPGVSPCVFVVAGVRVGVAIGDDLYDTGPALQARGAGAQVVVVPGGWPYRTRPRADRRTAAEARARECGVPVAYVNRVGGEAGLAFDGASFVLDAKGALAQQLPAWHEALAVADFDGDVPRAVRGTLADDPEADLLAELAMRDRRRNDLGRLVPERASGRAPSAAARARSTDQDTLPPRDGFV
ncbi:MAG: nitrilase-related carbon-nitrogen hydrolase [Burkholderiales bacterium]